MTISTRKVSDCRDYPEAGCSLTIAGTEDEVVKAATEHAVSTHGFKDGPELRNEIRSGLKDESDFVSRDAFTEARMTDHNARGSDENVKKAG